MNIKKYLAFSALCLAYGSAMCQQNLNSLSAWRAFKADTLPSNWVQKGDTILLAMPGKGDLVSKVEVGADFDLNFDFIASPAGNSGLFYWVDESTPTRRVYESAIEYQILDNRLHADNKKPSHLSGAIYDLVPSDSSACHPAGSSNQARITVSRGRITHYLNGKKVSELNLDGPEYPGILAASKFANWKHFVRRRAGHLALQDHGDQVRFYNFKFKQI